MSMESLHEYGSGTGVWRVRRLFQERDVPLSVFGVAQSLPRNSEATSAFVELGHEIAGHSWRWTQLSEPRPSIERAHRARAVEVITNLTGSPPLGWYTGRDSPPTRQLVVAQGGSLYDSDSYADNLSYFVLVGDQAHLVVPYMLDTNDMRFPSVLLRGNPRSRAQKPDAPALVRT